MALGWRTICLTLVVSALGACAAVAPERQEYERGLAAFAAHDYQGAEQHFNRSIELCMRDECKECAAQEAQTLLSLARVYSEQGKYSSAERTLKRAVDTLSKVYGAESKPVAEALLQLAVCHHSQAEFLEAAPACERALTIEEKLGPQVDELLVAATLNNLAETYKRLEQEEEAQKYFDKALGIYRKHAKEERAKGGMIDTLNNMALFYRHENRPGDARRIANEALELAAGTAPRAVQRRASVLATLATLDRGEFELDRAEQRYLEAISVLKSTKGTSEELLCQITDTYADLLLEQKEYDKAEKLYLDAIAHCRSAYGKRHPLLAERMNDLAELYREQHRYPEAEKLLEEVLATDRISFETDSPITFASMNSLSSVYLAQKKFDQAQNVYADWMPTLVGVLGPDHPHVADAYDNWALVAERSANAGAAASLREKAKQIRMKSEQAKI